jgi:hypothetical protein
MKQMPNFWIGSLNTFDDTIKQIDVCLDILKDNAKVSDFSDIGVKNQYTNDVAFMKQFFDHAEFLVRKSNDSK